MSAQLATEGRPNGGRYYGYRRVPATTDGPSWWSTSRKQRSCGASAHSWRQDVRDTRWPPVSAQRRDTDRTRW